MITPNKEFFQWIYNRLVYVHNENPDMDYMRSFKERIEELSFDKSSWKPSEEQMGALEHFIRCWGESGTMSPQNTILCAAQSLLRDLKKLM